MTRTATLLAAACVLAAQAAAPAAPRTLVFVGSDAFRPYHYVDNKGEPRGFTVEIMRALARETGLDIEIRLMPPEQARRVAERGDADLLCVGAGHGEDGRFRPLLPLWRLRQVAVVSGGEGTAIDGLSDLAGRRVLVARGSLVGGELLALPGDAKPEILEFPNNDFVEGARRLRNGEAHVMLANGLAMAQQRVYQRFPDLRETTLKSIPYFLVAASRHEGLQPLFFAAFTRMQESGEFNAIIERTLLPVPPTAADRWGVYAVSLFGLGAVALLGVATWNRMLRSQVDTRTGEFRAVADRLELHGLVQAQVTDALIVVNTDSRITMWNAAAEAMFGIPASAVLGASADALLDALLSGVRLDAVRAEVARSGVWRGEATARRSEGNGIYVDASVQVLRRQDGSPDGHLFVLHDIDRRKRAEHQRAQAEQERRKLELHMQQVQRLESLGVLAGGIAHDFNNLLVGMLGHAGLALQDLPPESPARERLQQIELCAQRASELTNQMLAYSGQGRGIMQPTELSAVAEEMANLLQTAINKGARLDLRLAAGLPAILADRAQLRQVVMNLITNASDAIGERRGTITVTTGRTIVTRAYLDDAYVASSAEPGDYVYIEVQDSGCGMDAETRGRIFEPFFTTKTTGRGLGLAAVLGIVRGHRGAVHLDSAPGHGTTFRVLFPSCTAPATREPAAPGPARARTQARILVVDDEPGVRNIAREALTRAGFTVAVAEDGAAAVELFRADGRAVDAVLLDMTMPGLSGIETLHAIHDIVRGVPVVLMSGYPAEEAAHRASGEVVADFLQKPFAPSALVAKMNGVLGPGVRA